MRVAVLADIHGNLPALEAVLRDVDAAGVEMSAFVVRGMDCMIMQDRWMVAQWNLREWLSVRNVRRAAVVGVSLARKVAFGAASNVAFCAPGPCGKAARQSVHVTAHVNETVPWRPLLPVVVTVTA